MLLQRALTGANAMSFVSKGFSKQYHKIMWELAQDQESVLLYVVNARPVFYILICYDKHTANAVYYYLYWMNAHY